MRISYPASLEVFLSLSTRPFTPTPLTNSDTQSKAKHKLRGMFYKDPLSMNRKT